MLKVRNSAFENPILGYHEEQNESVCIGGGNKLMGLAMGRSLKTLGLEVEFPYVPFKGESSSNIVNRARHQGVQIEMSSRLRKGLIQNPKGLKNLAAAIRAALDLRWETK